MNALRAMGTFLIGAIFGLALAKMVGVFESLLYPEQTVQSPLGVLVGIIAVPTLGFVFAIAFGNLKSSNKDSD